MTRFTVMRGYNKIIGGRDLGEIFEPGRIYDVKKILGEYVITDIGEAAEINSRLTVGQNLVMGTYLLTAEERKKETE